MNTPTFSAEYSLRGFVPMPGYIHREGYRPRGGSDAIPALEWGSMKKVCEGTVAHFSSVLWDIPWGQSWERTCAVTPGPAEVGGRVPDYCEKGWGNIWGNWKQSDPGCCVTVCDSYSTQTSCSGTFSNISDCINAGCGIDVPGTCQYDRQTGQYGCCENYAVCNHYSTRCG
jgi:hypothetical protein